MSVIPAYDGGYSLELTAVHPTIFWSQTGERQVIRVDTQRLKDRFSFYCFTRAPGHPN